MEDKKFHQQDIDNLKILRAVIAKANFNLQGDAISKVASLLYWLNDLETKIDCSIKKGSKPTITEIK